MREIKPAAEAILGEKAGLRMGAVGRNRVTGQYRFGYSGMFDSLDEVNPALGKLLPEHSIAKHGGPTFGCAEVAVCSQLFDEGAHLEDIDLFTFFVEGSNPLKSPITCKNCQSWLGPVNIVKVP